MPTLRLRPTTVVAGGDALARDEGGRVVFVTGALPGELVDAEVVEERKDFARARTTLVVEPDPGRVVPPCPHVARGCGGCSWQHVGPDLQRRLKADVVVDALRRLGGLPDPVVELAPPVPDGGRTTLRLAVGRDGRPAYRRGASHDLVEVDSCLVASPLLEELVRHGRYHGATEVVLRAGARTGERLVLATPTASGIEVPDDVVTIGDDELARGRRAWIHEELAGRRWRISPRSFAQARPEGAEALVDAVRDLVPAEGHLIDAYGGIGLFGGALGAGRRVTVIERSASAVADARANLADLDATVLRLDVARWRAEPAAVVVADPARSGLGAAGVDALRPAGAPRLVLVSCDAAAAGRDAALLARAGYDHLLTTVVELFPGTPHVEAVSAFNLR